MPQRQAAVKVHGVFPSNCGYPASLPEHNFHRAPRRDSTQNRYTIHAGRNLPDKEFRYLRTVIVTAAVYWGFGSNLQLASKSSP